MNFAFTIHSVATINSAAHFLAKSFLMKITHLVSVFSVSAHQPMYPLFTTIDVRAGVVTYRSNQTPARRGRNATACCARARLTFHTSAPVCCFFASVVMFKMRRPNSHKLALSASPNLCQSKFRSTSTMLQKHYFRHCLGSPPCLMTSSRLYHMLSSTSR